MGIVHTERLCISFLEPLLVYFFLTKYFRFNIYFRDFLTLVLQAGGANDHPTFTNFLQLYRMLLTYNLLKPPQFSNCSVLDSNTKKNQIKKLICLLKKLIQIRKMNNFS
jgi:hypothetical protein